MQYVVIVNGRVVFSHSSQTVAAGFLKGRGVGELAEVLARLAPQRVSRKPKTPVKRGQNRVAK
jgi:hypothetical protein